MSGGRSALVVSHSHLRRDPRIRREIDWLTADGWTVDTFGLGETPDPVVREHFAVMDEPGWLRSPVSKGLVHTMLPYRRRFRALMESRVPRALRDARQAYELVLVNDIDWLPWLADAAPRLLVDAGGRVALDLHEWHPWEPHEHTDFTSRLLRGYHEWLVEAIADSIFDVRATVAEGLAELYQEKLGIPRPTVIRNSPTFVPLEPSPVDPDRIELAYHGSADITRGLGLLADAIEALEPRFRVNFMLVEPKSGEEELRRRTAHLGDRVAFHAPVPMTGIAERINAWDLEIIFYPPTRTNLRYSLPNKFFEAVQGRLGVVTGRSPEMQRLIAQHGLGTVVDGWRAEDLAAALNGLSVDDIDAMKTAAARVARELSAEQEREVFLRWIEGTV